MHKPTSDNKSLNFDMRVFTSFIDKGKNNKYSFEQNANGTHIISTALDGTKKTYSYKARKQTPDSKITYIETVQIALDKKHKKHHFVVDENNKIYEYIARKVPKMGETFCVICTYENGTSKTFIRNASALMTIKEYKEAEKVRNQIFAYMIAFSVLILGYAAAYAVYGLPIKDKEKQQNIIEAKKDSLKIEQDKIKKINFIDQNQH